MPLILIINSSVEQIQVLDAHYLWHKWESDDASVAGELLNQVFLQLLDELKDVFQHFHFLIDGHFFRYHFRLVQLKK